MYRGHHFSVLLKRFELLQSVRKLSISAGIFQQTKEILKIVDPYSKFKIRCNCNLKIVPYDLLDCPDSNLLRASLVSATEHKLDIEVNGNEVVITDNGAHSAPMVNCMLEVPIKANFEVLNNGSTSISDLYSDEIRVESGGNIETKSLRCTLIELRSADGIISCSGTTLAQIIKVVTTGRGSVLLDKLQGGEVDVETNNGDISVNSSYTNNSNFRTNKGNLLLKSIHKSCQVISSGPGRFIMNGFYGTLNANVASREVSLQLSEIVGESTVTAKSAEMFDLAISDTVYDNTEIDLKCNQLEVEPGLTGDQHAKLNDAGQVSIGNKTTENKLNVEAAGFVTLRKMSWADTFGFAFKNE